MEVLFPLEVLDEADWISPRISFSHDLQAPTDRFSSISKLKDPPEDEFSFNFSNSLNIDLPSDDSMLSADELFLNGKLRPLQRGLITDAGNPMQMQWVGKSGGDDEKEDGEQEGLAISSIHHSPRCFSMTVESCRGDGHGNRSCLSLNNSRCPSPSRTMSMPHTTPTSPKAPLSSFSHATPSLLMSSSASSMPSTSTSSRYSSRFKDFFKLKRMNVGGKDPSLSSSSASAALGRECPQSSNSASCRVPSKSFWPFSRSNSAGESKTGPAISPPPRRSNSAGEGKTTSSSLLPMHIPASAKHSAPRGKKDAAPISGQSSLARPNLGSLVSDKECSPASRNVAAVKCFPSVAMDKKGLPPLPSATGKKSSPFFVPVHCVTDAVALSVQSSASSSVPGCIQLNENEDVGGSRSFGRRSSLPGSGDEPLCASMRESSGLPDPGSHSSNRIQHDPDTKHMVHRSRVPAASPGRATRRNIHGNNLSRNFARGSPGRRGAWNSPGRSSGSRVTIRNLERVNPGHVRPKDMLSRDGSSVRVSPVINVGVPSLRGPSSSSSSKAFGLGHLFSRKEKAGKAYNVLPLAR